VCGYICFPSRIVVLEVWTLSIDNSPAQKMAGDDRSGEFTAVLGFFIAICTVLVVLRCYCKVFLVKKFAADDYLSVITLVSAALNIIVTDTY
jgi:hypothetical protein